MSLVHIEESKTREVTDYRRIEDGVARQVVEIYHITSGAARLFWEFITGWIFTSDKYAVKTSDGHMVKCKDQ